MTQLTVTPLGQISFLHRQFSAALWLSWLGVTQRKLAVGAVVQGLKETPDRWVGAPRDISVWTTIPSWAKTETSIWKWTTVNNLTRHERQICWPVVCGAGELAGHRTGCSSPPAGIHDFAHQHLSCLCILKQHMNMYMNIFTYVLYMYTNMHKLIHMFTCTHTHTHTHTHIHTHTHTHTHTSHFNIQKHILRQTVSKTYACILCT